jgi:tRNA-specific 2-thiouridylase
VVQGHDHPALQSQALSAGQLSWVAGKAPAERFVCAAKVRYRQQDQVCEVHMLPDGSCEVRFEQPQRAVTPGQYVVFYQGAVCLGGGVIDACLPASESYLKSCRSISSSSDL